MHEGERVSSKRGNLYRAYKLIYLRYRKDLKHYPSVRVGRLSRLIGCRTSVTPEVLLFALERQWVRIRFRSALNAQKSGRRPK